MHETVLPTVNVKPQSQGCELALPFTSTTSNSPPPPPTVPAYWPAFDTDNHTLAVSSQLHASTPLQPNVRPTASETAQASWAASRGVTVGASYGYCHEAGVNFRHGASRAVQPQWCAEWHRAICATVWSSSQVLAPLHPPGGPPLLSVHLGHPLRVW